MHKKAILGSILLAAVAGSGAASDCKDSDTVDTCWNAIGASIAGNKPKYEALAADAVVERNRALSVTTTGDVASNAFGSGVSLNDFLNLLNIAVDPGTGTDNEEQISLEYSPTAGWLGGDFKLGLAATQATLPDPIKMAIDDGTVADAIENDFTLADDVSMSLSYSYMGQLGGILFGRSADAHQNLLNALVVEAKKKTDRDPADQLFLTKLQSDLRSAYGVAPGATFASARTVVAGAIKNMANGAGGDIHVFTAQLSANQALAPLHDACKSVIQSFDFAKADVASVQVADCMVDKFVEIVVAESQAEIASVSAFREELADIGFFEVSTLVNNQSQLVVSANARSREDLAGGNEYGFKVALEWDMSGHNVSNLTKHLNNVCWQSHIKTPSMQDYADCSSSIAKYISDNPVKKGGWRVTTSLEYSRTDSLDLTFPDTDTVYQQEKAKSFTFSLVGGRQFDLLSQAGLPTAKLDIGASYEDVSDDPMRQDRAKANITFTQQVADATQLSVGMVWANKSKYRGDADSDLSARLGLNHKFGPIENKAK